MTLVGFKAQNHHQQTAKRGADDTVDDRETAPDTFDECLERWGPFTIDVAAAPHNKKCDRYYTLQDDALAPASPWDGRVWCNPPYSKTPTSDLGTWVEKALQQITFGTAETVTMLLPANRTEQRWWQEWIEPYRETFLTTHFLAKRRRFIQAGATEIKPNERPPFGLVVVHIEGGAA